MQLPLLRESPYDHEVTRKVKRAATEIDKFRYFQLISNIKFKSEQIALLNEFLLVN